MTEKLTIGDKIFLRDPNVNPMFGYYRPYSLFKRLYHWFRGQPTKEYIPGILDKQGVVSSD